MSAEDLDKLFRDKLKNNPVAPSSEAWERLQARMQQTGADATPNPFMVPAQPQEKEERKPVMMWYYSAAAAAVTLLLSVGLWVNRDNLDLGQASGPVATVQVPTTKPKEVITPLEDLTQKPAQVEENIQQETEAQNPAVTQPERMASATMNAYPQEAKEESKSPVKLQKKAPKTQPLQNTQAAESSMMASNTSVKRTEGVTPAPEDESLEIIVKLDNSQATTSTALASTTIADTPDEEEKRSAGRVVKSIFKQVKHLRDGEKISREELGIPKHTFALETRIGNKRISKTIEL
ncbi:hypothetical protein TH63_07410 [Rufibacter radiotolerans]|uniref:Uncharacterized protein n=1 Tax=Rufibacter radiotolerans TaxID=1379910 RepID=A0A0H4W508_9BACT|nr:hypothetical protein [Rufibacter radiotolerans]AKQ45511.1 hypothetical protein TH63_07410 [Rufibacter radiotolerans]